VQQEAVAVDEDSDVEEEPAETEEQQAQQQEQGIKEDSILDLDNEPHGEIIQQVCVVLLLLGAPDSYKPEARSNPCRPPASAAQCRGVVLCADPILCPALPRTVLHCCLRLQQLFRSEKQEMEEVYGSLMEYMMQEQQVCCTAQASG
jgi:hypothetical protein